MIKEKVTLWLVSLAFIPISGNLLSGCADAGTAERELTIPIAGDQRGGSEQPFAGEEVFQGAGMQGGGIFEGGAMTPISGEMAGEIGGEIGGEAGGETGGETGGEMTEELPPDPRVNAEWIGGPCEQDLDCPFEGGMCLPDAAGYPRGMCTQECTRICPDQDGLPVTFCIDGILMGPGGCVQRCDYVAFSGSGCRPGYRCVTRSRSGEPSTTRPVCLPSDQVEEPMPIDPPDGASDCLRRLSELGVIYEARGDQRETLASNPSLVCEIDDAVRVQNPINGVVYRYIESTSASSLYGSCELMLAVYELSGLLREYDIVEVGHIGTYNCREISGTGRLSRHGYGDAIDLGSFFDSRGVEYNLLNDWQHNTTSFTTDKARVLYEIGEAMHQRGIFNIVLTPNYDAAHDNHFHVDLTPGGNYHGKMDGEVHQCGNE